MGSLEVIQKDKGGNDKVLIVISIMLFTDFYVQGRRLWALMYGTISVLWLTNLILFIVSLVISEAMK